MEWEADSPCHSHTYPGQVHRSPPRFRGWELELRDCGPILGFGLLLTAERGTKGMWGRRLRWEVPVEESQAAVEARQYCWVPSRGWGHHHSLSLPTQQCQQLNSREPGPLNAWHWTAENDPTQGARLSAWCTELQSKTLARRIPSMCLMCLTTEKAPRQGSPLSAWTGWAMRKD